MACKLGQNLKLVQGDREVKKNARECKIMSTDTTDMSQNRRTYFAKKVRRIMAERKVRAMRPNNDSYAFSMMCCVMWPDLVMSETFNDH